MIRRLVPLLAIDLAPVIDLETDPALALVIDLARQIRRLDLERDVSTRLTFNAGFNYNPVWSPDGHWLVEDTRSRLGGALAGATIVLPPGASDALVSSSRALLDETTARVIDAAVAKLKDAGAIIVEEAGGTVTGFAAAFANSILSSALLSQITQIVIDNYWDTPLDITGVISRSTASAVALIRQRVASALDAALATIGLMDLTNVYMNSVIGVPNDGLVPRDSTALPGATHRELLLGDHASPVMDVDPLKNFWTAEHRNSVTRSLVEEVRALAEGPED